MLETIELGPFVPNAKGPFGWERTQPFVIAFVYPKDLPPVVVKGMSDQVTSYIEAHYPFCVYHWTAWYNGCSRTSWRSPLRLYIFKRRIDKNGNECRQGGRQVWCVSAVNQHGVVVQLARFRTMPRKWLPIYSVATQRPADAQRILFGQPI